ncbi:unnamed protein product, partial [Mesorhabditis belari]|uniref:ADP/ATP translocase n=1 Tax=Mesorhabditis belari TaxID=2138241 RepID=A0AAF3ENU4_9BILA
MSSEAGPSHEDTLNLYKKMLLGGSAAIISKTTTAPIDRVKLILQVQPTSTVSLAQYEGMRDCFRKLFREQGILSLWRGNSAGVARCFPNHALNFAFRDVYRTIFLKNVDRNQNFGRFFFGTVAAGGAGGATTLIILYPMDFARTRMAVDCKRDGSKRYKSMTECLFRIQEIDGYLSWYRGFCASLYFVVASRAVFFGLFDTIRTHFTHRGEQLNFVFTWMIAQSCLMVSGLSCYPLDSVRRRLMVQAGKKRKHYRGTMDCCRKVYRSEGLYGFYKGALTNSLRSTGGALIITLYYEMIKYL